MDIFSTVSSPIQSQMNRQDSLLDQNEKERIELFISCRNLDDLDFFTVTDSFLVVKLLEMDKPERNILRTKVYWNDLNPNYAETVLIDFYFEIKQRLVFEVYHQADPPKLVGRMESSLGEIFGSPEHGLVRDLTNKDKKSGKIIVRCEKEDTDQQKIVTMKLGAQGLPNLTWLWFFGGTNAFYRVYRRRKGDELMVYESQTVPGTNPSWREMRMSERRLAGREPHKEIEVRIFNYSQQGRHEVIGSAHFSLMAIQRGSQVDIRSKKQGSRVAVLKMENYVVRTQYQFGDFLQKGLQLALVTCIDFTASNKLPTDPTSLHYTGRGPSAYQKALRDVTSILLDYDYDKLVPMFGFGAKVRHPLLDTQKKVHHCFPLNCSFDNPNLYQLEENIRAYKNILPYLQFSGPTLFAALLREAMKECEQFKRLGTHYMILFILTDGEIHDKQEVFDLLIQCNFLPMSVIIVGIGDGSFEIMHELDDDNCEMVDSKGNRTQRDLVQFVEFSKFKNNGAALAQEVLFELPRQVSEYFQLLNKCPQDVADSYKESDIDRVKQEEVYDNPYI